MTVTVLYYNEPIELTIRAEVLRNLPFDNSSQRVKLPEEFKKNKLIVGVLLGECIPLNHAD